MAALAYLLLPVTGAVAYFASASARVRFHGLQAIVYGVVWALVLYGCARLSIRATQLAFGIGGVGWLGLIIATAVGTNPRLPLIGRWLHVQSEVGPREQEVAFRDEP
ncbi:MAG: hypothetical protein QOF16_1166 [Actinomycetota bacterium]|jgi:uncharacterized membrane protein|nr:hypothetical protein [Actinomycetota bacterium]MEA2487512.1 hypothetical protein [Actinomycetota bacterium]